MRGVDTDKVAYAAEAAAAATAAGAASPAGVHIKSNPRKKKGASPTGDGEQVRDSLRIVLERPAKVKQKRQKSRRREPICFFWYLVANTGLLVALALPASVVGGVIGSPLGVAR